MAAWAGTYFQPVPPSIFVFYLFVAGSVPAQRVTTAPVDGNDPNIGPVFRLKPLIDAVYPNESRITS